MDTVRIQAYKIQAKNKYKRQQFLNNIVLYSLTTLVCTLFCSSPLWYPPLCAMFNVFLFFSLPKISGLFFSSKALFIIGNLIVIFLVGESKIFASSKTSSACDVIYNEHKARSRSLRKCSSLEKKKEMKTEEYPWMEKVSASCQDEGEMGYWVEKIRVVDMEKEAPALPAEELNKLADDFIAKVNRQRRLEAVLFSRG